MNMRDYPISHSNNVNKGNNKITEHRAIFQREKQNSKVNKQTKSVNRKVTVPLLLLYTYIHTYFDNKK